MSEDEISHQCSVEGSCSKNSRERVADMLVELSLAAGASEVSDFSVEIDSIPTSQALGLTPIHLHATMRRLAREGLVTVAGRSVKILDVGRLRALATP